MQIINMTCGIYNIQNENTGDSYVGLSIKIEERWKKHKIALRHNKHVNDHLQNAWNKYGENIFSFLILEECEPDMLSKKEIEWGQILEQKGKKLYNKIPLGNIPPSQLGTKAPGRNKGLLVGDKNYFFDKHFYKNENSFYMKTHSIQTRQKLSEIQKGKKHSKKTLEKFKTRDTSQKINFEIAQKIRKLRILEQKTLFELAQMFNISCQHVSNIINNKVWKESV